MGEDSTNYRFWRFLVSKYHSGNCPKLTPMHKTLTSRARWVSEGGACKEFYFRTEFIFPPRWENYLVGWCGEGKAAKGIFQVSESERITNRKTHQWFARRSRILSDSRNKTQADTNRVSRMPICISGLTHMHQSYIHFSRVLGTGGAQRQSTWTVPHGKYTQHGNESTWQLKQGKALGSREGEWAIILRTAPFIGLVQKFPSTGYSTDRKDERPTMRGGNQVGEVRRAPSEESWAPAETYNRSQIGNCPKLTSMGKTLPDQERVSWGGACGFLSYILGRWCGDDCDDVLVHETASG